MLCLCNHQVYTVVSLLVDPSRQRLHLLRDHNLHAWMICNTVLTSSERLPLLYHHNYVVLRLLLKCNVEYSYFTYLIYTDLYILCMSACNKSRVQIEL